MTVRRLGYALIFVGAGRLIAWVIARANGAVDERLGREVQLPGEASIVGRPDA